MDPNPQFGRWAGIGWEWANLAFLAGGAWLLYQRIFTWHAPVAMLASLSLMAALFYDGGSSASGGSPLFHLLSGATMFGAFFIVTDPVTSAVSVRGRLVYGALIGVLVYIIRVRGNYPDAVAFAVLIMNFAAPFIDHYTQPRTYGHQHIGRETKMLRQSITRNSVLLAIFAVCTTLLITGTYLLTKDRIALEKRKAEEKALLQIVPRERHDNSMLDETIAVGPASAGLGLGEEKRIYIARQADEIVAVIIPATAPDGYTGDIDLMVGVNSDGSIAGVRALSHKETPGLGDKVDLKKSDWVLGFNGRSLENPTLAGWAVKKDKACFDQFTGATITPRAVVAATLRVLQFAEANRATLFDSPDQNRWKESCNGRSQLQRAVPERPVEKQPGHCSVAGPVPTAGGNRQRGQCHWPGLGHHAGAGLLQHLGFTDSQYRIRRGAAAGFRDDYRRGRDLHRTADAGLCL